jgi:hypothetical protein
LDSGEFPSLKSSRAKKKASVSLVEIQFLSFIPGKTVSEKILNNVVVSRISSVTITPQ